MAGGSLLALIDDIASILDDVSVMTKVAIKKTSGVLGDDLALNAQQVTGVSADRELPVVWAVAKGSLLNKCILIPSALLISAWAPWAILPLLMMGGAFLCYEGAEKIQHLRHSKSENNLGDDQGSKDSHQSKSTDGVLDSAMAPEEARAIKNESTTKPDGSTEKAKIRGAIRTDFVLSAEIIVITLGVVAGKPITDQIVVLSSIGLLMTIGVYGLVAVLVKLDDMGLYLLNSKNAGAVTMGRAILKAVPWMMRFLSVVGTAAMFLVGGSILIEAWHDLVLGLEAFVNQLNASWAFAHWLTWILPLLVHAILGLLMGYAVLALVSAAKRIGQGAKRLS